MAAPDPNWRSKILRPRWPWSSQPIRPADVMDGLAAVMLARENTLEDAYYHRIVPNRFIIEVSQDNYARNYQNIENQVTQQLRTRLLEELTTANSRLGRREYTFGGPVQVDLRPAEDLHANQVRILWQVGSSEGKTGKGPSLVRACLEVTEGQPPGSGQKLRLRSGITTIGRYDVCDIYLDKANIQQKRLVSGQHAYFRSEANGNFRLFDGSPTGKPSANGTYVNYHRVPPGGVLLHHEDLIILAAPDPDHPRPGIPGTAAFFFLQECTEGAA